MHATRNKDAVVRHTKTKMQKERLDQGQSKKKKTIFES